MTIVCASQPVAHWPLHPLATEPQRYCPRFRGRCSARLDLSASAHFASHPRGRCSARLDLSASAHNRTIQPTNYLRSREGIGDPGVGRCVKGIQEGIGDPGVGRCVKGIREGIAPASDPSAWKTPNAKKPATHRQRRMGSGQKDNLSATRQQDPAADLPGRPRRKRCPANTDRGRVNARQALPGGKPKTLTPSEFSKH